MFFLYSIMNASIFIGRKACMYSPACRLPPPLYLLTGEGGFNHVGKKQNMEEEN